MKIAKVVIALLVVFCFAMPVMADLVINGSTTPAWKNTSRNEFVMNIDNNLRLKHDILDDEFEGNTLDTSLWTLQNSTTPGTATVSGNTLFLQPASGTQAIGIRLNGTYQNYTVRLKSGNPNRIYMMLSIGNGSFVGQSGATDWWVPTLSTGYASRELDTSTTRSLRFMPGNVVLTTGTIPTTPTSYHIYDVSVNTSGVVIIVDGATNMVSANTTYSHGDILIASGQYTGYMSNVTIDYVWGGNYTSGRNITHWGIDAGSGNVVSGYNISVLTPPNTNYSLTYINNVTKAESNQGTGLTATGGWINGTIAGTKYQIVDFNLTAYGNNSKSPEEIEFIAQSESIVVSPANCSDEGSDGIINNITTISRDTSSNCSCDGVDDQEQFQYAISNASSGDTILLCDANSTSPYNITASVNVSGVNNLTIKGTWNSVVRHVSGSGTDVAFLVDYRNGASNNITFDGFNTTTNYTSGDQRIIKAICVENFTVKNTYSFGYSFAFVETRNVSDGTSSCNENILITNNTIKITNWIMILATKNATISHNNVTGNGIDSNQFLKYIYIHDNWVRNVANGPGIRLHGQTDTIVYNNTIIGDTNGQGIRIDAAENLQIYNNTIKNGGGAGIGIHSNAGDMINVTIKNNYIYNNAFDGIRSSYILPTTPATINISNNVIFGNGRDGINETDSQFSFNVWNNIVANNTGYGISNTSGGASSNYSYNNVWNNLAGNYNGTVYGDNNISFDPLFNDTLTSDFHLKSKAGRWNGTGWELDTVSSPAIDAGDPTSDYSLEPAPNGSRINMGAYGNTIYASKSYTAEGYNISGYVNDTLGSPIDVVSVVNGTNSTTTNATGYYIVPTMSNGTYNFSYSKTGYVTNYKQITIAGADVVNQNVTLSSNVSTYMPPTPINLIQTNSSTGYWINHTWQSGSGNVTDSFNVSQNGTWTNGSSTTFKNVSVGAHNWSNISVYAFNSSGTGTLNQTPASMNTQVPNSPIYLTDLAEAYYLHVGDTLSIDANYTDADGDTGTFSDNSPLLVIDPVLGTASATANNPGIYEWQICVNDGNGSNTCQNMVVVSSINYTSTIFPTDDTTFAQSIPNQIAGASGDLGVGTGAGTNTVESVLRFQIPSSVPSNTIITKARLNLTVNRSSAPGYPGAIKLAYLYNISWNEENATYANHSTDDADYYYIDILNSTDASSTNVSTYFDILGLVGWKHATGVQNISVYLQPNVVTTGKIVYFKSKEDILTQRPQLELEWVTQANITNNASNIMPRTFNLGMNTYTTNTTSDRANITLALQDIGGGAVLFLKQWNMWENIDCTPSGDLNVTNFSCFNWDNGREDEYWGGEWHNGTTLGALQTIYNMNPSDPPIVIIKTPQVPDWLSYPGSSNDYPFKANPYNEIYFAMRMMALYAVNNASYPADKIVLAPMNEPNGHEDKSILTSALRNDNYAEVLRATRDAANSVNSSIRILAFLDNDPSGAFTYNYLAQNATYGTYIDILGINIYLHSGYQYGFDAWNNTDWTLKPNPYGREWEPIIGTKTKSMADNAWYAVQTLAPSIDEVWYTEQDDKFLAYNDGVGTNNVKIFNTTNDALWWGARHTLSAREAWNMTMPWALTPLYNISTMGYPDIDAGWGFLENYDKNWQKYQAYNLTKYFNKYGNTKYAINESNSTYESNLLFSATFIDAANKNASVFLINNRNSSTPVNISVTNLPFNVTNITIFNMLADNVQLQQGLTESVYNGTMPSHTALMVLFSDETEAGGDITPPTYSGASHNQTIAGLPTLFSIQYNDETALHPNGQWIFATNNTGEWANDSTVNWSATPEWANVTKTLNSTVGTVIGYRWYANDSAGNINNTPIYTLTVTSVSPPNITSWSNNKTNNASLTLTINTSEGINFNATTNQTITTWLWAVNGTDQSVNYDNFSTSWATAGLRNVSVNSTNTNGTSNTIYWDVDVILTSAPPPTTFMPPSPVSCSATTGNFWINMSCSAGTGNTTDGMNKSMNSVFTNDTVFFKNITLSAHAWGNGSFYAYNGSDTGLLNLTPATLNTQIPNNAPVQDAIGSKSVDENQTLYFQIVSTDTDGDALTYITNATHGYLNSTGYFTWTTNYTDSGTYYWSFNTTDNYSAVDTETITVTVNNIPNTFIPPVPVTESVSTGNFYVNYTWLAGSGNVTNGYNVSVNGAWDNSSANTYHNTTLSAHAWHNVTVFALNTSEGQTLSATSLSNNTRIPNNNPSQTAIGSKSVNEGEWLNITITSSDIDGDDLTYATNATKGTLTTNSFSWLPNLADAGTYYWTFNTTDNYSAVVTETIIITVNNVNQIPPIPVINTVTTGNFWINTTWQVGVGNITDGYNSTNGTTWVNNTLTYRNTTLSAHVWQNLTIYAYNSTDNVLSLTPLINNTQIPNNVPIMNSIGSKSGNEGEWLNFSITGTDLDSDSLICSSNNTKGTLSNCNFNWSTTYSDAGTYNFIFYLNDSYSGSDSEIVTITIDDVGITYIPPSPINLAQINGSFWVNYTWEAGTGNITNSYNVSQNGTWTNGSVSTFKNTTLLPHGWSNISVYSFNTSSSGTLNLTPISSNTQLSNNAPTITSIGDKNINEGQYLNFTVSATDTDSDSLTYTTNATHGYFNSTGYFTWLSNYTDSGTYYWSFNVSDLYGGSATETITVTITNIPQTFMPPSPSPISETNGSYYVNHTWSAGSGNATNLYNISVNNIWTNGTANVYSNNTTVAHGWINISVYAFNTSETGTLNLTSSSKNTRVQNVYPVQSAIGAQSINESQWLNFTISSSDADGDSLTYATNATKGNLVANVFSWLTTYSDSGTYYWTFNTTDNYSAVDTETITITVNNIDFVPPVPVISTVTTGNFYINTTWTSGSGNVTDGYNSTNGTVWINNTLPYRNTTLSAHAWQNLTIYAFNNSGTGSLSSALTNNTRIPNNIPSIPSLITPTNSSSTTTTTTNFTWSASTDLDGDTLTYDLRVNGTVVTTGITSNYTLYNLSTGINNWSVRSYDGYNYSAWSSVYNITYSEESTTPGAVMPSYGGGGSGWAIESLNKTATDPVTILPTQAQEEATLSLSTNNFTFYYKTKSPTTLRVYDMSFRSECETVKLTISNTNDIVSINTSCKIQGSNIRFIVPNTQPLDSIYYKMYGLIWVKKSSVPTDMTSDGKYLAVLVKDSDAGQYTFIQSNSLYELQQIVSNPAVIIDILKAIDKEIYSDLSKKVDFKW